MEEMIRRTVGPVGSNWRSSGCGGLWPTLVDPNQLENALLNLCINARDAMPDGGRLTIETANKWLDDRAAKERELPPGQYVSLCVTDTGTGMAPAVIAHVFEPFFTTKPFGQGTGLGLSMIYGFARQSGGQIRIYTELGKGTTMCLYLPWHDRKAEAEDLRAGYIRPPRRVGEIVIVIDDEPTIRMLISEVLEEQGYATIEASDGPLGNAGFAIEPPGLICSSPTSVLPERHERPPESPTQLAELRPDPESVVYHRLCGERRSPERAAGEGNASVRKAVRNECACAQDLRNYRKLRDPRVGRPHAAKQSPPRHHLTSCDDFVVAGDEQRLERIDGRAIGPAVD